MSNDAFERFLVLFSAGFGLLLAGGANLLLLRATRRWRAAAAAAAFGCALAVVASLAAGAGPVFRTAGLLAAGALAGGLLGSSRVWAVGAALAARPAARWGAAAVAGVAVVAGSAAVYQAELEADLDRMELASDGLLGTPATGVPEAVRATTDRGTHVPIREHTSPRSAADLEQAERGALGRLNVRDSYIRRGPADDAANCHGWVFAGGRYWVGGNSVDLILRENGYAEAAAPRPGDLAVYRDPDGVVTHTAVVRAVGEGLPVLVEGKWGAIGVFLHPVEKSPYGTSVKFHRSPRNGHLLAGLGGPASGTADIPVE